MSLLLSSVAYTGMLREMQGGLIKIRFLENTLNLIYFFNILINKDVF